jgi:hypothetical protein
MEHIRVIMLDLPYTVKGFTVCTDTDCYDIYINARMGTNIQQDTYDHEIAHINNKDFDKMYTVDYIENLRYGA